MQPASLKTVQQKTKLEITILEKHKAEMEGGRVQKELCGRLRHAVELIDLGSTPRLQKKQKAKGLGGQACGAPQALR